MNPVVLSVYKNGQYVHDVKLADETIESIDNHEIEYFLGRAEDCHVVLDDQKLSRYHATIVQSANEWRVKKTSNYGPVLLNGVSVTENKLSSGDALQIGPYLLSVKLPDTGDSKEIGAIPPESKISQDGEKVSESHSDEELQQNDNENSESENEVTVSGGETETEAVEDFSNEQNNVEEESNETQPSINDNPEFPFSNDSDALTDSSIQENPFAESENAFSSDDSGSQPMFESADSLAPNENPEDNDVGEKTAFFTGFIKYELSLNGPYAPYDKFTLDDGETYIGRDSSKCQLVLKDSEVSSVHAVIRKNATGCEIEDLNSSNGTILNGDKINKAQLKSDDEIAIGSTKLVFNVESELLMQESEKLMPVEDMVGDMDSVSSGEGFADDFGSGTEVKSSTSIFKDPQKRKKIIYGVVGLMMLMLLLEDEPAKDQKKGKKEEKSYRLSGKNNKEAEGTKTDGATSQTVKKEKNYTEEEKQFLESTYLLGKELFDQGKYAEALFELEKIFNMTDDYKGARQLADLSKQGLAKLEELERKRREEEERRIKQKKVDELLVKTRDAVENRKVELAEALFAEILQLDPENLDVSQLKIELDAWKKEQERIALEKAQKEAERKRQLSLLSPGKTFYLKKDWYKAIVKLEEFLRNKDLDEDLIKEASQMLTESREKLQDQIDPLLSQARSLKNGQDLKGAYQNYSEILKKDPSHVEALNEINEIRDILEIRSQKIYREAIISESLSLFDDAREKFEELQQVAPQDSEYYKKASEKLRAYLE